MFCTDPEAIYDKHRQLTYSQAMERYSKRFKAADEDGDGKLNMEEYADFLHPGQWKFVVKFLVPYLRYWFLSLSLSLSYTY